MGRGSMQLRAFDNASYAGLDGAYDTRPTMAVRNSLQRKEQQPDVQNTVYQEREPQSLVSASCSPTAAFGHLEWDWQEVGQRHSRYCLK